MSFNVSPEINLNTTINNVSVTEEEKGNLYENAKSLQEELANINNRFNEFLKELNEDNNERKLNQNQEQNIHNSKRNRSPLQLNMITKMYSTNNENGANNENELPDRIYLKRNSLLTEMLRISHFRTIRHIFISIMIVLALQVIYIDLTESGRIFFNFDLIHWCFGKMDVVFWCWSYMLLCSTFLVYYCFHHWSNNRLYYMAKRGNINQNKFEKYDLIWLACFIIYLLAFIMIPAEIVRKNRLPPASSFVVLLEQLRQLMKSYAFVRSNVPRAISNGRLKLEASKNQILKKKDLSDVDSACTQDEEFDIDMKKNEPVVCPNFSSYLYFCFAPTLVYRDHYPRTSRVRWQYVSTNLAQCFGAILYTHYIFSRFCIPVFQHFNTNHVSLDMFIHSILNCTLPGTLLLLVAFYAFLHCWLNAFAEMTKFGDRMFYKDWWNSTNYSNYYRSWNTVVHDFLYTYIYKDAYYLLGKKYKTLCQFIIFVISAFFHEYVLTFAFGFFYPVLFVMFGACGFLCMFLKSSNHTDFWNLVTWLGLLIGLGGLMCLYSIEWYARINCPQSFDSVLLDYLLPRSFTCRQ